MSSTDPRGDVVGHLAPEAPGTPAHDNHGTSGPPAQEVIERGYEADVYDSRTVLSVPLLVILFFVLAFTTVTILFALIAEPKPDRGPHPLAAEKFKEPLNDRLKQLGRGPDKGTGQPRLEPLRVRNERWKDESRAYTRPELPVADGNSPEIHPEDLRVTKERFPALFASGGGGKLGLDKTMEFDDKALEKLFPVQKNGTAPPSSQHVPTAANAGRGAAASVVVTPGLAPAPPPHHKGDPK